MIQLNETLIQLTTRSGMTPYDLIVPLVPTNPIDDENNNNNNNNNNDSNASPSSSEYYQTLRTLLQPLLPSSSFESVVVEEGESDNVAAAAGTTTTTTNDDIVLSMVVDDANIVVDHNNTVSTDTVDVVVEEDNDDEFVVTDSTTFVDPKVMIDDNVDTENKMIPEGAVVKEEVVVGAVDEEEEEVIEDSEEEVYGEEEEEEEEYTEEDGLSVFELAKHAIAFHDIETLRSYVEEYPQLLQEMDDDEYDGKTLLHYAVQSRDAYDIVSYLVEMSAYYVSDEDIHEDEERFIPIWTISTHGVVDDVTGQVMVPPQTPYEYALEQSYATTGGGMNEEPHPIVQLLQDVMEGIIPSSSLLESEEVEEEEPISVDHPPEDVNSVEKEGVQEDDSSLLLSSLDLPNDNSNDILADALRDFDAMKQK
jgi:hypothetical protein